MSGASCHPPARSGTIDRLSAPLSRPHQSLLYVFNCGVPAGDGPYRERAADIGPRLVALARETERLLGYS